MPKTRIPSPSRSQGSTTPGRHKPRGSRSVCSPALSNASGRLTSVIDQFKDNNMESFSISPMKSRWSVLTDNTDIDEPRRKSWWKNLNENSQDFMEVLEDNKVTDSNNFVEDISDIEIISQEDKNYSSLDLPESSDNESVHSIVLTQRKLFTQKENKSQKKFEQLIGARDTLAKLHKSNTTFHDKTITAGTKDLFHHTKKSKPVFSALLNISANKTTLDKTIENVVAEPKVPVKNIFGNRHAKKRKNIFADFIVSDSEHEVSDIQVQAKQSLLKRKKNEKALDDQADEGKKKEVSLNLEEMVRQKYNVSQEVGNEVGDNQRNDLKRVDQAIENQKSHYESTDDKENENKHNDDLTKKSTAKEKNMDHMYNTGLEFDNDDKASGKSDTESNASLKLTYDSEEHQEIDENIVADKGIVTDGVSKQDYQEEMEVDNCDKITPDFSSDDKIIAKRGNEPNKSLEIVNKSKVHQELHESVNTDKDIEAPEVSEQDNQEEMAVDNYENEENTGIDKQKSDLIVDDESVENEEDNGENVDAVNEGTEIGTDQKDENEVDNDENEVNAEYEKSEIIDTDRNEENVVNNDQAEENEVNDNQNKANTEHEESEGDKDQNEVDNDENQENEVDIDAIEVDAEFEENQIGNDENEENEVDHDAIEVDAEFEENQLDNGENEEKEVDNDAIEVDAAFEENQLDNGENEEKEVDNDEIKVDAKFEECRLDTEENEDNDENDEVDSDNNEESELENDENEDNESDNDESQENELNNEENEVNDENEEEVEYEESEVDNDEDEVDYDENNVDAEPEESEVENDQIEENEVDSDQNEDTGVGEDENEEDDENEESNEDDDENREKEDVPSKVISSDEVIEESPNVTHDTTGRNRKKIKSPEVVLHDKTKEQISFIAKGRNTSIREMKTMYKDLKIKPSMAPPRDSLGLSAGDSSAEGSGWDSHRTTRKTLRQTFGKDFTPRKSLRALVMEKSAKQIENVQTLQSETVLLPQANSTEYPQDSHSEVDVTMESDHEVSRRTRQTTLETYLQKMKQQNLEKKLKMEQAVRNSLKAPPKRDTLSLFKVPSKPPPRRPKPTSNKPKKQLKTILFDELPSEVIEDMKYKPPKRFQPSNASWITKRLYKFLENKLEPKYDYKARVRAEKLVETIYHFAKDLRRHNVAPVDAVDVLKHELARLEVVKTHFEFYEFFHEFMPREVRVKVVPDIVNKIPLPRHGVFADILRGNTVQG